jgi:large subunit ribosomal protein L19
MKTALMKIAEDASAGKVRFPDFKAGDTITVFYKIKEGNKEREQQFQGVVLQRKGKGASRTFTVRKISGGIGVERIFPLHSPKISKIKVDKKGSVRRARIFYLRDITGKAARIEEKRAAIGEGAGAAASPQESPVPNPSPDQEETVKA